MFFLWFVICGDRLSLLEFRDSSWFFLLFSVFFLFFFFVGSGIFVVFCIFSFCLFCYCRFIYLLLLVYIFINDNLNHLLSGKKTDKQTSSIIFNKRYLKRKVPPIQISNIISYVYPIKIICNVFILKSVAIHFIMKSFPMHF